MVGASERASSVGTTVIRNLSDAGFDGPVFPVNPKYERVFGKQAYAGVGDLPETADLAVICTPARTVPGIVRECGRAGIPGLVILSAGFREAGDEGARLEAEVEAARREFDGMRIVGPNCLGLMVPHGKLNASFAGAMPAVGRVAFVSQSGAVCTSVLDRAAREGVGFSSFDSVLGEGHDVTHRGGFQIAARGLRDSGHPTASRGLARRSRSRGATDRLSGGDQDPLARDLHKTDVGGVELNVAGDDEVRSTFEKMIAAARRNRPDAGVDGVTVRRMVSVPRGCEMIVAAR